MYVQVCVEGAQTRMGTGAEGVYYTLGMSPVWIWYEYVNFLQITCFPVTKKTI